MIIIEDIYAALIEGNKEKELKDLAGAVYRGLLASGASCISTEEEYINYVWGMKNEADRHKIMADINLRRASYDAANLEVQ